MTDRKVWMVTGGWRGLGRVIAEGLLERGELVVATARNTGDLEGLKADWGSRFSSGALVTTVPLRFIPTAAVAQDRDDAKTLSVNVAIDGSTLGFEQQRSGRPE